MSAEARRSRKRRERTEAEPARETPPEPRPRSLADRVLRVARSPRGQRALAALLIGSAILAVVAPFVLWVGYRLAYVESRNAIIRGSITHIGAQIDGVVTSVEVNAGQQVRKGQLLAVFEDHQLQANLERARSQLRKASRQLEVERLAIEQEARRLASRVAEASARTDAARIQEEDASAKYEMRKTLADRGMIAPEELRGAETARRTALADRATTEATQQVAEVESDGLAVRRRHLVVLDAEVQAAQAELDLAQADLKAAQIRAPADGWVVRRIAEPGASVVVGQPLVALWIGPDVWVEAWIDERDLAKVKPGSKARVTVKPYPRRVFMGTVETVGVSTDFELPDAAVPQPRNTRLRSTPVVCVRVRLNDSKGLFPGLSAVVGGLFPGLSAVVGLHKSS